MISSHRIKKAEREGLEAVKQFLLHSRYGKIQSENPYTSGRSQANKFSEGFSYGLNNWKFLKPCV